MPYRSFDRRELATGLGAAGVGLWALNHATHEVRWTPNVETLFGMPEGSFGGTLEAVLAEIHEDDRERVREFVDRSLAEGRSELSIEYRTRPRGGRVRWLKSHGSVVENESGVKEMMGAVMDITDRKEAERAAEESAARYRLFTQLASDYVYDFHVETGVPGIVAGSFERVTGYTPEEIGALGGWLEVVHPDDRDTVIAEAFGERHGRPYALEYRIVTRDGDTRWIRDRGRPVSDPVTGEPIRFIGGVHDVTEIKELEQELLQAQRMEALAELSGRVAHDFNNLLTIVLGALGLVERRAHELPAELSTYLGAAHEALDRATELTRSLLTFGRHEVATAEVLDLRSEMAEICPLLESAAGEGVDLELRLDAAAPAHVLVDSGQLRLALMNLVLNARDAMDGEGRLVVRLGVREVGPESPERPADLPPGAVATIEVIDHGPGIEPEHVARIFEPYFTTKGPGRGSGLGLAIAYGVTRKHGGTISVTSEVGVGTTFTLWFPLSEAPLATRAEPRRRVSLRGVDRVLVVDDDEGVRAMVSKMLESHGYQVKSVGSAEAALALSDEELGAHDLVLSDVRLGGMDGVTLAARLRERCPALRVLLISGYADEAHHEGIRSHGFRLLPKPFTPTALVTAIHETLQERVRPLSHGRDTPPRLQ